MTYYDTLGVATTASTHEIKKAYRKLASVHHPDKEGGDTKKFQEIQAAYDTLSDEGKRSQYDLELSGGGRQQFKFRSSTNGAGPNGMEDILNHLHRQFNFNGGPDPFEMFRNANQQREPRNKDVRLSMQLKMADTLEEQVKTLNVTLPGNLNETIEIKIPRGVAHGTTIRYPGLGDHSVPNAPRADLYIQFHITSDPYYEQSGIDIITQITINCFEAIVGCEHEVKGIDGKVFKVTIPAGSQVGAKFGIPNQGLYSTDHPGRGRLIVNLNIYIPKYLTEQQLKIVKDLSAAL